MARRLNRAAVLVAVAFLILGLTITIAATMIFVIPVASCCQGFGAFWKAPGRSDEAQRAVAEGVSANMC